MKDRRKNPHFVVQQYDLSDYLSETVNDKDPVYFINADSKFPVFEGYFFYQNPNGVIGYEDAWTHLKQIANATLCQGLKLPKRDLGELLAITGGLNMNSDIDGRQGIDFLVKYDMGTSSNGTALNMDIKMNDDALTGSARFIVQQPRELFKYSGRD